MPTEIRSSQVLMKHRGSSPNVTKNLPMAGFNPIIYGRFWVITEDMATGELRNSLVPPFLHLSPLRTSEMI
jgi:hypothetical protein